MSQPTPYDRLTSFTDHSTDFPSTPQSGVKLDQEFDAINLTTDEIRTNLALIQRDDGKLADGVVTVDAVSAELLDQIGDAAAGPFATAAAASAAASAASAASASAAANAANDDAAAAGTAKTDAEAASAAADASEAAAAASAASAAATAATVAPIDDAIADDDPGATAKTRSAAKIGDLIFEKTAPRPEDFGAVGDGATDDKVALQAWLDNGGDLFLPPKHYYSSLGLKVRKQVHVRGSGYGFDAREASYADMPGSRIRFADDAAVSRLFDVQPQTTLTDIAAALAAIAGGTFAEQEGAHGSTFRDFALIGPNTGIADGFYSRTVIHSDNVHCVEFGGRGHTLMGTADIPNAGDEYGNISTASIKNCVALENGSHGLHVRGRDANTCKIENFNAHQNGGWGVLEESLLGNKHDKPHIAGNSLGAIKSIGEVNGSVWDNPYIEPDAFSNCEIGGANSIAGGDLTAINTPPSAPPSMYGAALTTARRLKFVWNTEGDFAYPIASICMIYRDANLGLVLAGEGSGADICFKNKAGTTIANVATGGIAWSFKGDVGMDGVNPILSVRGTGGVGSQLLMASDGVDRLQVYAATGGTVYVSADNLVFREKNSPFSTRLTLDSAGANLGSGMVLKINGTQVVGARGAAVADAVAAVAAPTKAEFDALVTQVNALLARCRAHGLIAT